jgi:hypothetical protein
MKSFNVKHTNIIIITTQMKFVLFLSICILIIIISLFLLLINYWCSSRKCVQAVGGNDLLYHQPLSLVLM